MTLETGSRLGALTTALAATIGTDNLVGVATALLIVAVCAITGLALPAHRSC